MPAGRRPNPVNLPAPIVGGSRLVTLPDGTQLTVAELQRWRWTNGILRDKLYPHQTLLADNISGLPPLSRPFLLWARRTGKTTFEMVSIEEFQRQNPGSVIRFAGPTQKQVQSTIIPIWRLITMTCPEDLKARYKQTQGCWEWPNGSRLYVAGTDHEDDVDRLRGPFAHRIYVDELGFHHCDLRRLIDSVLAPQLNTTGGMLIMSTTPPESREHSSVEFISRARSRGMLFEMDVIQAAHAMGGDPDRKPLFTMADVRRFCEEANPDATPEMIDQILANQRYGSEAWEREYKVRLVSNPERRVIPSFDEHKHVGQPHFPRQYNTHYVFIDQADGVDEMAAVFATHSYSAGKLYVEAEWLARGKNTEQIVTELRKIEKFLWGEESVQWRYSDDPRGGSQRKDMTELHRYRVQQAKKSMGKQDMANGLDVCIRANKVVVHPNCKRLISQLADGIYKASSNGKLDFERSRTMGHLDALDALAMGVRCVSWNKNPAPHGDFFDPDILLVQSEQPNLTQSGRNLMSSFRMPR